jgi:hypothetical protein
MGLFGDQASPPVRFAARTLNGIGQIAAAEVSELLDGVGASFQQPVECRLPQSMPCQLDLRAWAGIAEIEAAFTQFPLHRIQKAQQVCEVGVVH